MKHRCESHESLIFYSTDYGECILQRTPSNSLFSGWPGSVTISAGLSRTSKGLKGRGFNILINDGIIKAIVRTNNLTYQVNTTQILRSKPKYVAITTMLIIT